MVRRSLVGAGVLAAAPAFWWLGGLLPGEDLDGPSPDFAISPPDIGAGTELALGITATVVCLLGAIASTRSWGDEPTSRLWPELSVGAGVIAAYLGLTYRVGTEPVIGANIGFGLMVLGLGPVCIGVVAAVWLRATRRDANSARRF